MNAEPTIQETLVDINACNLMGHLGEISKKIAEIQDMIETIRQANRKGYSDIVRDHVHRIIPRLDSIHLHQHGAKFAAEKLYK